MICLLRVGFDDADEPDDAAVAPVAERLGNYRIEHRTDGTPWELGRGAMGVTYRAIDTSLQRPVALKLIDSEWVKRGAEARERFMREARVAAALRHPNVAAVHHFGIREESGQCFCAMELIEGETLEMRVRRTGPIDAATTVEIALQVSSALAAAEKQGLVHRDLKPANLMLVGAGPEAKATNPGTAEEVVVKVIDFGVAKALVEKPDAMGLTHGGFVGTPAFASPEQFTKAPVDVRSDIYSLGATLWYLLTGHMPFPGATVEEIRASQHLHALPIEQLKAARVPRRLISLIVSMLAAEPAARPGVRTLTSELQECRAQILDRWKTARRFALAAALIGIAATAVVLFDQRENRGTPENSAPANVSEKSIAVLPFENLSFDKENAFFASGIQDEILTALSKISGLKVISRTSTARYQSKPDNLSAIAAELRVAHIVEGSVQRAGDRVRIHVQLIRADTDEHVWAESYDRTLSDIFAIEGEIAKSVVHALQATLTPAENESLTRPPTENPEAYVFYLRGREYFQGVGRSREQYQAAESLFERAIALDPRFASAWALLSRTLININFFFEATPERKARALAAAQEALRLQPHSGEAHRALAAIYANTGDHERRLAELQLASRALPNDTEIITAIAFSQKALGKWAEARAGCERAAALGPNDSTCLFNLALCAANLRDWPTAASTLDRLLALTPDATEMKNWRAWIDFHWRGDLRALKAFLASIPPGTPDPDGKVALDRAAVALFERDYLVAEQVYAALPLEEMAGPNSDMAEPKALLQALVCLARRGDGDARRAQTYLEKARLFFEAAIEKNPQNAWAHANLGRVYANLGWRDAAVNEGLYAVELCPESKNAIDGVSLSERLAYIYAALGEADAAIPLLDRLLRTPNGPTLAMVRCDPEWDPIRKDPRFDAIVSGLEPKTIY